MLDNVVARTNSHCEKFVFDGELCVFNFQLDSMQPLHCFVDSVCPECN